MAKPSKNASFISSDWEGRNVGCFQRKPGSNTIEFVANWRHLDSESDSNQPIDGDFIYLGDTPKRLLPITSFDLLAKMNPSTQIFGNRDLNVLFAAATIKDDESISNYIKKAFDDISQLYHDGEKEITYASLKQRYHKQRVSDKLTYVDPGKALLLGYVLEGLDSDQYTLGKAEVEKAKSQLLQMSLPQQRILLLRYLHNETFGYPLGFEAHCFNLWLNAITDFIANADNWQEGNIGARIEVLNTLHDIVRKAKSAEDAQQQIKENLNEWLSDFQDENITANQTQLLRLCDLSINHYNSEVINFFQEFNNCRLTKEGVLEQTKSSIHTKPIESAYLLQKKDNIDDQIILTSRHYPGLAEKDDAAITELRTMAAITGVDDNESFLNLQVASLYDEKGELQLSVLKSIMRLTQPDWAQSVTSTNWQTILYHDAVTETNDVGADEEDDDATSTDSHNLDDLLNLIAYGHQPAPFPLLSLDGSNCNSLIAIADDSIENNEQSILRNAIALEGKEIIMPAAKPVKIEEETYELERQVFNHEKGHFTSGLPALIFPYTQLKYAVDGSYAHLRNMFAADNTLNPILMGCFQDKANKGNMQLLFFAQGGRSMNFKKVQTLLSIERLFEEIEFFPQGNDTTTKSTLLTQLALQAPRLSIEDLITLGKCHAYLIAITEQATESNTDEADLENTYQANLIQPGVSCLSDAAQTALKEALISRLVIAQKSAANFVNKADHSTNDKIKQTVLYDDKLHTTKYEKMRAVSDFNAEQADGYSIYHLAQLLDDFKTGANIHRRKNADASKHAATITDLFAETAKTRSSGNLTSADSFENLFKL